MQRFRNDRWFIKRYQLADLYCQQDQIEQRCILMRSCSNSIESIPQIDFIFENSDELVIRQHYIEKDNSATFNSYQRLAIDLDLMHKAGLVHGDLHPRNLIISHGRCYIIDFEPCYIQKRYNIRARMSSKFTWSELDRKENKLTSLTDKVGFYKVVSLFHGSDQPTLTLDYEKQLKELNCRNILEIIGNNNSFNPKMD